MTDKLKAALAAATALWAAGPASAQDQPDPRALVEAVEARDTGDTQTAELRMLLQDDQGNRRERVMTQRVREDDSGTERSLIDFSAPADVAGTQFLTIDRGGGTDETFLYLPELDKVRRIGGSNQSDPFMGSDFTYADMSGRDVDEWVYELMDQKEVRGHMVWRVIARPASQDIREKYGYERSLLYIRPDIDMMVRAIHETTNGETKYLDVRDIRTIDGIRVAHELEMRTVEQSSVVHATLIQFSNVAIDVPLDGAVSRRALGQ